MPQKEVVIRRSEYIFMPHQGVVDLTIRKVQEAGIPSHAKMVEQWHDMLTDSERLLYEWEDPKPLTEHPLYHLAEKEDEFWSRGFQPVHVPNGHRCMFTRGPFFNMSNSYMACEFCGARKRC